MKIKLSVGLMLIGLAGSLFAAETPGPNSALPMTIQTETQFAAAQPVWPAGRETERNLFVGFRVKTDARAACLRYSASSIARTWLNGEFLCYGPARGPHGIDRMDEIDLRGRMKNGENVLAFEVAGYNVESYYLLNEPAYLAAEILDAEGRVIAATREGDTAFEAFLLNERVQKVPRFSYQRPFCEVYSLAPGWDAWRTGAARASVPLAKATGSPKWIERVFPYPDYTVSRDFKPIRAGALTVNEPKDRFVGPSAHGETANRGFAESEMAVHPVFCVRRLGCGADRPTPAAGALKFEGRDYVLLDHGFCDTGFLGARVVCTKPGRVYFHFDEVLVNGDVDVGRMSWQCVNTVTYDFTKPGVYEVEAFEPNTFKYLKVTADGFAGTVENVYLRGYKNAAALKARYSANDPALEKIFAAARETFAQNAVDAFTDCPSRERAGWLCDSFFSARVERLLTGRSDVERGFLQNYALCPKTLEGGFLPMCYPADAGLLPNWNFWLILEVEEYLKRSGDRALVDELRPKLEGIVAAFRRYRNSDGLLEKLPGWVFIEWSFANSLVQDVNYPSNMTYAEVLDVMARLYGLKDCAEEAKKVRETVRRQSWTGEWFCDNAVRQKDGSLKLSGECTETCQYYAFFFRTATPESHPDLWKRLLTDFGPQRKQTKKHPKIHFSNAFIGNYLRLELLSRAGLSQQILDETKGYFLGMAERTGTLWEHDNIGNSCDHGFASHVAVWLAKLPGARISGNTAAHGNPIRVAVFQQHLELAAAQRRVPVEEAIRAVRSWGIEGVDLWYDDDQLASNAKMLAGGLQPATLILFMDFAHTNDVGRAEAAIAYAKRVGSPRIMLVPGFRAKTETPEAAWRAMKPNLADFLARATRAGLEVDVEDFDDEKAVVGSRESLRAAFAAFPSLGHVLDTGNYHFWKDDVLSAQKEFASRIRHVHIKDRDPKDPKISVASGTGLIPVKEVVSRLSKDGYRGFVTIECYSSTNLWDDIRRSADFLKGFDE